MKVSKNIIAAIAIGLMVVGLSKPCVGANEAKASMTSKTPEFGNVLPNPGFEEKGQAWTCIFWSGKGTKGEHKWTDDAHSGTSAIEIIGSAESEEGEAPRGLFYSPPVQCSSAIYEISGYYKTKGHMLAHLQIHTFDTAEAVKLGDKHQTYNHKIKSSPEWKLFKRQFSFSRDCRQVIVMLRGSGIGSVFFDDVKLEELNEPVQAHLFPGRRAYDEDKVYIIEKNIAPIQFGLTGDINKFTYPISLEIEVPSAVKLYSVWPLREVDTSAGRRKIVIELTEQDIRNKMRLQKRLNHSAWAVLWAEVNEPLAESQPTWRLFSDKTAYPQKSAKLFVKPALPEKQYARNFDIMFGWRLYTQVPKELWERVYQLYRACGINCYLIHRRPDTATQRQWVASFKRDDGKIILNASPAWRDAHMSFCKMGEDWLIELATGGADVFEKMDNGFSADLADEVDGFLWDAEFIRVNHLPYGRETLAAFADHKGLNKALVTRESVKTKYLRDYQTYCVDYLAGVVLKGWVAYMKKLKPDALLIAQQGAGADGRHQDIAYYDIEGITHAPMIYTASAKSWANMVEQTCDYACQPVMPTTWNGMHREGSEYACRSPESIRLDILTAATLGCPGMCFYPDLRRQGDGLFLWQMARASANIRSAEEFFTQGNRIDQKVTVKGLPELESEIMINGKRHMFEYPQWRNHLAWHAFQIRKDRLVTVQNMNAEKTAFVRISARINWPQDGFKVYDTVSGTRLVPSLEKDTWNATQLQQGVLVEIPPSDAVFLMISRDETDLPEKTVCVKDTLDAYEQLREQPKGISQSGEISEGNLKITWDDIDHDGSLEVLMASPAQKVWITPSGGLLSAWKIGQEHRNIARGGGMDLFWMPRGARWQTSPTASYRIVRREIKNGIAYVTLQYKVSTPLIPGLVISKTYSIDEKSTDVTVSVKITNESPEPVINFSYWSHNGFSLGSFDKLVYETSKGTFVQKKAGISFFAHRTNLPENMIGIASKANLEPIAGNWLATWDEETKDAITVVLDNTPLLQIYKWASRTGDTYTMEWMYQPVGLKSFESWNTKFVFSYQKNRQWQKSRVN